MAPSRPATALALIIAVAVVALFKSTIPSSTPTIPPQPKQTAKWNERDFFARFLRQDVALPHFCHKPERTHEGDGGWDICLDALRKTVCVVYSGGTRDDASFDVAMKQKGCEVHSFDPSLKQMEGDGYGSASATVADLHAKGVVFHDFGLGGFDLMYPPGTAPWTWPGLGYGRETNSESWQLRSFESTMRILGHWPSGDDVDERDGSSQVPARAGSKASASGSRQGVTVFKSDIEGAEWPMLERLLSDSVSRKLLREGKLVRQFLFELHFLPRFENASAVSDRRVTKGNKGHGKKMATGVAGSGEATVPGSTSVSDELDLARYPLTGGQPPASSSRHPRVPADVDAHNLHLASLLWQLIDAGFVIWKHNVNTDASVPIVEPGTGKIFPCCHEVSLKWVGAPH